VVQLGQRDEAKYMGDNEEERQVAKTISSLNDEIEGWTSRQPCIMPFSHVAIIVEDISSVAMQYEHIGGITSGSRRSSHKCRDLIDVG
jgi:hypothetical protein